jgi:hypothetical protein
VRKIIGGPATVVLLVPAAACGAADAPDAEAAAQHFVTAVAAGSGTETCALTPRARDARTTRSN